MSDTNAGSHRIASHQIPDDNAPKVSLGRDDIIDGLRELVGRLQRSATPATIRIVGGAALLLTYFERAVTADIDGPLEPTAEILQHAERIAVERGWQSNWINNAAEQFLPNTFGRKQAQWVVIFNDGGVLVARGREA